MLNRVNYTRVFDLAGLVEAVDEVAKSWEAQTVQTSEKVRAKARVIEDSEEEDEPDKDDEDETNQSFANQQHQNTKEATDQQAGGRGRKLNQETHSIDMIVIDTISNVVTSVLSKSQVQGIFFLPKHSIFRL